MKELDVSFFEKPRPKAKQRKNAVGIIPIDLNENVLSGKKKITVYLTKKVNKTNT